jgi:hypothetical protein
METGEPISTVFSNIGEDLQYRCFSLVYDVKSVTQTDTMQFIENNYWFQMTETGFAD